MRRLALAAALPAAAAGAAASAGTAAAPLALQPFPLVIRAAHHMARTAAANATCVSPDDATQVVDPLLHCYSPADIAAAYGVDRVHARGDLGQGHTIVLVDS